METREELLDVAQELAQKLGYNAFSFHDLAKRVGIRTASVHYYFPNKGDLGREMMTRYRLAFLRRLHEIERREKTARRRLKRFVALFQETLLSDRLCLCGTLATEYATLPAAVQREVRRFFGDSESWLARVLEEGRRARELAFDGPPAGTARTLFSAFEGAMIAARTFGDPRRLGEAGRWMVAAVSAH